MEFFDDEFCRPFTSGSREPPDRQDGFLETTGYYRKHTARDPSSLFRVVSEHVFDIQLFHEKVREDCANYLEMNRKDYEKDMDKNFYYYLSNLRKLRTPGGLLELKALAHCYKRNVMLFEPFTAGKWYIQEDDYQVNTPILVFYTADKHFDSIYYKKDIELAAKCQGLIFEILYKEVFQLPDVSYAVERMLHDQLETNTKPLKEDPTKYQTVSGKIVDFDNHETTSCVLENSMMCHFHNRSNFEEFVDSYSVTLIPNPRKVVTSESTGRPRKPLDGFLYDMNKSCVRQLLDEKITPFPYKVAKALDRSIYRNIEFDLWNDNRKELRMKWMEGNPMDRPRLSHRPRNTVVNPRIPPNRNQENSIKSSAMPDKCLIYIDPYGGEKEVCIGGDLVKMNYDKRYGGAKYGSDRGGYHYFYPHYNSGYEIVKEEWDDDLKKRVIMMDEDSCSFKMDGFQHFQPYETETVVMPASMQHGRGYYKNKRGGGRGGSAQHFEEKHDGNQNAPGNQGEDPMYNPQYYEQVQYVQYDQQQNPVAPVQPMQPQNQLWNGPAQYLHQQYAQYPPIMPQYYHPPPPHPYYHQYPMQPVPVPPQIAVHPPSNQLFVPQMGITLNDALNLLKEVDLQANINFNVRECADPKELPSDEKSLQFYYNLGIKYFQYCVVHQNCGGTGSCSGNSGNERPESRTSNSNPPRSQEDGNKGRNNNDGVQSTPVSAKPMSILQNSGQKHQGNNGGPRKPFPNQRIFHQKRNDVKFNPNVKNVHKSDAFGKSSNNPSGSHNLTTSTANSSVVSTIPTISPLSPIPYEDVGPNNQQPQNPMYPPPFYTPPVLPYYQDSEHMPQYIQSIPGATYITVPMTPQTGPGPIIYQQPLDPNLSADSGIIEAQYTPGNYQQMVYVPGPQGGPHYAAPGSGNYVYYAQPTPQTPQAQPVAATNSATPTSNFQASPSNQ